VSPGSAGAGGCPEAQWTPPPHLVNLTREMLHAATRCELAKVEDLLHDIAIHFQHQGAFYALTATADVALDILVGDLSEDEAEVLATALDERATWTLLDDASRWVLRFLAARQRMDAEGACELYDDLTRMPADQVMVVIHRLLTAAVLPATVDAVIYMAVSPPEEDA
jgi:hypothetical protein